MVLSSRHCPRLQHGVRTIRQALQALVGAPPQLTSQLPPLLDSCCDAAAALAAGPPQQCHFSDSSAGGSSGSCSCGSDAAAFTAAMTQLLERLSSQQRGRLAPRLAAAVAALEKHEAAVAALEKHEAAGEDVATSETAFQTLRMPGAGSGCGGGGDNRAAIEAELLAQEAEEVSSDHAAGKKGNGT